MTDTRIGGLGRESLVSSTGELRVGGVVREALVSGLPLSGRIAAKSFGNASLTLFTGLAGMARARSGAQATLGVYLGLAGTIRATSSAAATADTSAPPVVDTGAQQYVVTVIT